MQISVSATHNTTTWGPHPQTARKTTNHFQDVCQGVGRYLSASAAATRITLHAPRTPHKSTPTHTPHPQKPRHHTKNTPPTAPTPTKTAATGFCGLPHPPRRAQRPVRQRGLDASFHSRRLAGHKVLIQELAAVDASLASMSSASTGPGTLPESEGRRRRPSPTGATLDRAGQRAESGLRTVVLACATDTIAPDYQQCWPAGSLSGSSPVRTSRPHAGRPAAAGRLISY